MKAKDGILMSVFGFGLCLFVTGLSFGLGNAYMGTMFFVIAGACALFVKGYVDNLMVELKKKPLKLSVAKSQWDV